MMEVKLVFTAELELQEYVDKDKKKQFEKKAEKIKFQLTRQLTDKIDSIKDFKVNFAYSELFYFE